LTTGHGLTRCPICLQNLAGIALRIGLEEGTDICMSRVCATLRRPRFLANESNSCFGALLLNDSLCLGATARQRQTFFLLVSLTAKRPSVYFMTIEKRERDQQIWGPHCFWRPRAFCLLIGRGSYWSKKVVRPLVAAGSGRSNRRSEARDRRLS
jgi:hypothetical protein